MQGFSLRLPSKSPAKLLSSLSCSGWIFRCYVQSLFLLSALRAGHIDFRFLPIKKHRCHMEYVRIISAHSHLKIT